MRNISFALTWDRLLGGSKTVTRRLGWARLKPGTLLMAYRTSQGEARDRVERFGSIRVVSVRRERLDAIDAADVAREGFPELSPAEFVAFFLPGDEVRPRHRRNPDRVRAGGEPLMRTSEVNRWRKSS